MTSLSPVERAAKACIELELAGEPLTVTSVRKAAGVSQQAALDALSEHRAAQARRDAVVPPVVEALASRFWQEACAAADALFQKARTEALTAQARAEDDAERITKDLESARAKLDEALQKITGLQEDAAREAAAHREKVEAMEEAHARQLAGVKAELTAAQGDLQTTKASEQAARLKAAELKGQVSSLERVVKDLWAEKA